MNVVTPPVAESAMVGTMNWGLMKNGEFLITYDELGAAPIDLQLRPHGDRWSIESVVSGHWVRETYATRDLAFGDLIRRVTDLFRLTEAAG